MLFETFRINVLRNLERCQYFLNGSVWSFCGQGQEKKYNFFTHNSQEKSGNYFLKKGV